MTTSSAQAQEPAPQHSRGTGGSGDTKQRILDAAEALFAEQGVAATSLRAIIAAAGVNSAAIHYHFGSKEALIGALFARRITPINEQRLARLDALERSGAADPASLLRAFLEPLFASGFPLGRAGENVRAALGRLLIEEPESFQQLAREQFQEVKTRFARAIANTSPGLSVEEATERIEYAMGAMLHVVGRPALIQDRPLDAGAHEQRLERLIRFLSPGFSVPADESFRAPDERRTA